MEGVTENGRNESGNRSPGVGGFTAFRRYTPNNTPGVTSDRGITSQGETTGNQLTSRSPENSVGTNTETARPDKQFGNANAGDNFQDGNTISADRIAETGSVGTGGSVERTRRRRRTNAEIAADNAAAASVDPNGIYQDENFIITVEQAALTDEEEAPANKERKARVRKVKEPPRTKVDEIAGSLKDVYQIADMVIKSGVTFIGKGEQYPDGLFELNDDVATRLASNLIKLNDSLPKLAQKFNTVSVPAMLISTFATDLFAKGVVLYGIVKSK